MKNIRRRTLMASLFGLVVLTAFTGASLWNKSDFCRGWGEHYLQRSIECQSLHLEAIADKRPNDAETILRCAKIHALIAAKYFRVANPAPLGFG